MVRIVSHMPSKKRTILRRIRCGATMIAASFMQSETQHGKRRKDPKVKKEVLFQHQGRASTLNAQKVTASVASAHDLQPGLRPSTRQRAQQQDKGHSNGQNPLWMPFNCRGGGLRTHLLKWESHSGDNAIDVRRYGVAQIISLTSRDHQA